MPFGLDDAAFATIASTVVSKLLPGKGGTGGGGGGGGPLQGGHSFQFMQQPLNLLAGGQQAGQMPAVPQMPRIQTPQIQLPQMQQPQFQMPQIAPLPQLSPPPEMMPPPQVMGPPQVAGIPQLGPMPQPAPVPQVMPLPQVAPAQNPLMMPQPIQSNFQDVSSDDPDQYTQLLAYLRMNQLA